MSEKIKISSIVIAKNEELNIQRCIESQLNCIDEVIVLVDESSDDKTFEEAAKYKNVKAEKIEWMGYSKTKQYGVDKASYDWVLWIDADEAITKELSVELNKFKDSVPDKAAYKVSRRAYFLGKWIRHSGWYPGNVTRLFNKNNAKFSASDVHEHLVVEGETGKLHNDLEHYTDPNIHHYFEKFNRYTTLAAEELNRKNRKAKFTDMLIRPLFFFIKMYFFRRGFLDGVQGFILAVFSSTYVFTKYCKLWELNNKAGRER